MPSFMKMRPKQGQVLVELLPVPNMTPGGLTIPDNAARTDTIGREPAREAIVRSIGVWPTTKKGIPLPYEVLPGNRVAVDPVLGVPVMEHPKVLRIYDHSQILALITA